MSATPGDSAPDLGRARLAGRELGADIDLASQLRPYEAHRSGLGDPAYPVLQLDDVSAIPFLADIAGVEEYQHRGRLRAGGEGVCTERVAKVGGKEAARRGRGGRR